MLARQNIPESQKDREWLKKNVDDIINAFHKNYYRRVKDLLAYNILQGNLSQEKYEYITKEFGKEYPVKLKNYPLIRPVIQTALGEETELNYVYHIRRIDEEGLQLKQMNIYRKLIEKMISDFEQALQGNKLEPLDERKLKELKDKLNREYLTELEILCEKLANFFEHSLDFKKIRTMLMASVLETGKCYWRYEEGNYKGRIGVRPVPVYNIVHANEDNIENISDCSWVCERMFLTKEQVLDKYANYLSEEDIEKIQRRDESLYLLGDYFDFAQINQYYKDIGYNPNYYLYDSSDKIEVYVGQWKSIRKLTLAEIENKRNNNLALYKLLDEKEAKKKNVKYKEDKYIQELYEFVRIGSDIYVWDKIGKSNLQIRSVDNPYYVKLHYGGMSFHIDNTGEEFSLVWYLKDLQELYNILNYHRERMIALSGVKGVIYDKSQLPTDMELHELLYYRKLGLLIIDSSLGTGQFNQFQAYNDSLDASIAVITQMLEDIRNEVDRVSGFNRQRQGQMFQKDLVGQIEKAIRQGSYATAVLYYFQSKVYKEMLEGLINYAKLYYYLFGSKERLSYVLGDGSQEIFSLHYDFVMADFGLFLSDNAKDNRYFEELKSMLAGMMQNNMIKASDVIRLLKVDRVNELETKILTKIEEAERQMQEMQAKQSQVPDKEIEIKKMELEGKMKLEQLKLKEMKEIKMLELEIEKQRELNKIQIDKEKIEIEKKYKQEILKLKKELLNLERKEYETAVVTNANKSGQKVSNRQEIKNIV